MSPQSPDVCFLFAVRTGPSISCRRIHSKQLASLLTVNLIVQNGGKEVLHFLHLTKMISLVLLNLTG